MVPKAAVDEIKTELKKEQQTIQTKKAGEEQHRGAQKCDGT